ncbi:MAG: DUF2244 domain-containing protein [Maricaulaceae bacterium]|jgi:uncharacterized membrane protein
MTVPETERPRVYLELELRPHRSLSRAGFIVLMSAVAGVSFVAGVFWVSRGFWPVTGFFGLDVLLFWLAFRASYRQARRAEFVRVTADHVDIVRRSIKGEDAAEQLPAHWTRVRIDKPVRHASQIELSSHGRTTIVGDFLPTAERVHVAKMLAKALDAARQERHAG